MQEALRCVKQLLPQGGRVLCAVSGGADSMSLLHLLWSHQADLQLSILVGHYHHGLRGEEADRDADFVQAWCLSHQIPCFVAHGNVADYAKAQGKTLEEAGRILRYAFLEDLAQAQGADAIAVAHHREDSAETLLFHLCRGTGLAGLGGIPLQRGKLIRPLLGCSRQEIEQYLQKQGVPYQTDTTNLTDDATRNRLRHHILPLLEELFPETQKHMAQTARLVQQDNAFLEQLATERLNACPPDTLPCQLVREAPDALQVRMLRQFLEGKIGKKDITSVHWSTLLRLVQSGRGQLSLPNGWYAVVQEEQLLLRPQSTQETRELFVGASLCLGNWCITRREGGNLRLWASPDAVLTVGHCRGGERLSLVEGRGSRTVKRLCLDQKYPPSWREELPAFFLDGKLAALWGVGTDFSFTQSEGKQEISLWITPIR